MKKKMHALMVGLVTALVVAVGVPFIFGFIQYMNDQDGDLSYSALKYDAQLKDNGDMHITQTVTVQMRDRDRPWRQLFQAYTLSSDQLTNIEDISVKNDTTGETYTRASFADTDTEKVSVKNWDAQAAKTWYLRNTENNEDITQSSALAVSNQRSQTTRVELGWNIPVTDESTQTFTISMTWKNVAKALKDGAYAAWYPVATDNEIPIRHLEGTITYPDDASENWTWMHYEGNGQTRKTSERVMQFSADRIPAGAYVSFVLLEKSSNADFATQIARQDSSLSVADIQNDERQRLNQWQDTLRQQARTRIIVMLVALVLGVLLILWLITGAFSTRRRTRYTGPLEYFRESVPLSPAAAAQLYAVLQGENPKKESVTQRALSATMLSLLSKKALYILPGAAKKYRSGTLDHASEEYISTLLEDATRGGSTNTGNPEALMIREKMEEAVTKKHASITYILSEESFEYGFTDAHYLSDSERTLLTVLQDISQKRGTRVISDQDIRRVSKQYDKTRAEHVQNMYGSISREFTVLGLAKNPFTMHGLPLLLSVFYVLAVGAFGMQTSYFAVSLIAAVLVAFAAGVTASYGSNVVLTDTEDELVGQVHGLARYLDDFSDFSDRGIEDMILWDRYLVYAAAFGMSQKVADAMRTTVLSTPGEELEDAGIGALSYSPMRWMWMPWYPGYGYGYGFGSDSEVDTSTLSGGVQPNFAVSPDFSSFDGFMDSFNSSLNSFQSDLHTAMTNPSSGGSGSGSFGSGGGSFGGGGFGAGGGSFGGR
ncbi:hypothetical protein B9G54_01730 [Alloscardovia macacae]|uniref:DUF2207 domain-containing protein n=1 Tax=Alloscardovia macacae TaxID=1160091 RepID=UPI000A2D5E36|nr:DUF2207 domain-containing protein [Alloscardovia macacae]OTA27266.1 hypothetical protein B9G54_01730 [Alloscardovia macacae]